MGSEMCIRDRCCCQRPRHASPPKYCRCCNSFRTCCNCDALYDKIIASEHSESGMKRTCNACMFGCCCTFPVTWDFYFESNRSRLLALFNGIMCILLLVATLNPLAPQFEAAVSCRNAFGFRPKLINPSSCIVEGIPGTRLDEYNCSGVDLSLIHI